MLSSARPSGRAGKPWKASDSASDSFATPKLLKVSPNPPQIISKLHSGHPSGSHRDEVSASIPACLCLPGSLPSLPSSRSRRLNAHSFVTGPAASLTSRARALVPYGVAPMINRTCRGNYPHRSLETSSGQAGRRDTTFLTGPAMENTLASWQVAWTSLRTSWTKKNPCCWACSRTLSTLEPSRHNNKQKTPSRVITQYRSSSTTTQHSQSLPRGHSDLRPIIIATPTWFCLVLLRSCSSCVLVKPGFGRPARWAEGIPKPGPTLIIVASRRETYSKREASPHVNQVVEWVW